jgi:secreted PhoX family phosphatase
VKDKSSVQRIKKEKRDRRTEPPPAGMTRRNFLTYLGAGSAALAAGSAGMLPRNATAQEQLAEQRFQSSSTPYEDPAADGLELSFQPIEPSSEDKLILPEGFKYDIIRRWGEPVTGDRNFGYNNDYVAYFPIDMLDGGRSSEDGILWVNHEYVDSRWVSEFDDSDDEAQRTPEQIAREKEAVGGSVIRVRKSGDTWSFVEGDSLNRRVDANTPMDVTGPAAGTREMRMEGTNEVIGTLANCSGGVTPWATVLSCEENYQFYYGQTTPEEGVEGLSTDDEVNADATWLNDPENVQPPEHYGWVVEVDPFDPESRPRKHTWLGRTRHENIVVTISKGGKAVAYTGHDENDERIYKFVSSGTYVPGRREENKNLLSDGMLYVADFANGRWVALDYENNPIFRDNGFASQADVLVRAPEAAALEDPETETPIGTPLDRCEDIEVHPESGTIYAALTNNENHGNFHGQIIRMYENDGDPEATEFLYEVFAAGGPNTGFSSPDNLAFDRQGNLWMVTDISSSSLNKGIYTPFKNNGMFVMMGADDAVRGEPMQFASGPVESEMTGPAFTPDGRTLFLAVQHPGEESESVENPSSTWPHDGDNIPKPSVVAITGFA